MNTPVQIFGNELIALPKEEGSKRFDMEIDKLNQKGIKMYKAGDFEMAFELFDKASNLAQQFRDPSRGVIFFNTALTLLKLKRDVKARSYFLKSKEHARGNQKILKSKSFN